ncbi:MAG TPA: MFS transporter [Streptosporangiaceae bacterium]|nr:MFS transporter [Streptosporangiaceae bacterium]
MATTRDAAATAVRAPQRPARRAGRPGRARSWLGAGFAVATIGWGANQFTPLLLLYGPRLGLSAAIVEATFGMYALGLMPGLLVAGRVSDRIGRRPVVLFSIVLSMAAGAVLMLGAHGVAWLFVGRVIMGVASGCGFSAGAAWIKELSMPPYARATVGAGARRASVAMTLGFGLGPLVAGAAGQWAPLPTISPYVPQLVLAVCAIPLALRTPETMPRGQAGTGGRLFRIHGLGAPRFLRVVLPLAPWVFGSAAIAMAFVPGLVIGQVRGIAVFFGALAALCTAASGVLVQPLARRLDQPGRPRLLVIGMSLVTVGLVVEAGVAALGQPILVLVAAALLGSGYGFCLVYGLAEVQRMARPAELAGMTAVFQAATYLGFAAPYLLSVLRAYASASVLLLAVAALAALTLVVTGSQARR